MPYERPGCVAKDPLRSRDLPGALVADFYGVRAGCFGSNKKRELMIVSYKIHGTIVLNSEEPTELPRTVFVRNE